MAHSVEPPIEWVPGDRTWWLVRLLVPAVLAGLLLAGLFAILLPSFTAGAGHLPDLGSEIEFWSLLGTAFGVGLAIPYLIPSVRRIGISPRGLRVDYGLLTRFYGWPELSQVNRIQER